jgi:single-strand DNA-binding protein
MSINKVILIGNLGSDPEVRYMDGNRVVANFSLATNESYNDKEGNRITQTEWHRIEMWDGLAKIAEKYLKKGKLIYLEGKIKTDRWTDKEGNEKFTTRIRANNMQMLGGAETDKSASPSTAAKDKATDIQVDSQNKDTKPDEMNDLPF